MSPNKKMIEFVKRHGSLDISLEIVKDILEELSFIYFIENIQNEHIANRINFYMDVENLIYINMKENGYTFKLNNTLK